MYECVCDGYSCGKWTRRPEFKSWTRLIAFLHMANTLGNSTNPIFLPPTMSK